MYIQIYHLSYPRIEHLEVFQLLGEWNHVLPPYHAIYDMLYAYHSELLYETREDHELPYIPALETILIHVMRQRILRVRYYGGVSSHGKIQEDRIDILEEQSGQVELIRED